MVRTAGNVRCIQIEAKADAATQCMASTFSGSDVLGSNTNVYAVGNEVPHLPPYHLANDPLRTISEQSPSSETDFFAYCRTRSVVHWRCSSSAEPVSAIHVLEL